MRTLAITVAVAGLIGLAAAQTTGPLPPLTVQVEVHVVNVDVTVTDANGNPVLDLTKDDFKIFEDGQPQKVANFYVIQNADVKAVPGNGVAAPASPASDQFRRKFVLLVDNNYIDKIQRDMALSEVDRFVDGAFNGEHEWAIAAISQRLEVLHPFTADKKEIHAAIDKIRKSGAFPEQHAIDRSILSDRLRRMEVLDPVAFGSLIPTVDYGEVVRFQAREQTYRALRAIRITAGAVREMTRAYGASEGKKVLILLTGGMETNTNFSAYTRGQPDREVSQAQLQIGIALDEVVAEANASNFAVHIINARRRGMIAPQHEVQNASSGINPQADPATKGSDPIDTTDVDSSSLTIALGTGGSYSTNTVDRSLAAVETLNSNYYSLGYSPKHEDDRLYHSIKVRVKRNGVKVAHRQGYVALSTEDRLEQFLQARFSAYEKLGSLPVKVQIGAAVPREDGVSVPVLTTIPMDRVTVIPIDGEYVGRVHVYVSVFDRDGKNIGFNHQMQEVRMSQSQYQQIGSANFRYKLNVQLQKGAFTIVITLRDDLSNEIGSASEGIAL
jgi:VWFA-related protein